MKKVLDFLIKFIYINIVNRTVFFYLVLIFIEAVYSENCSNAVLLTQKILPFYFKENQVEKLCKCGCKQVIIIKSHHKYQGIPDYISGHNRRKKWVFYVDKFCECGCKQIVKSGNRFIHGHSAKGKNNFHFGKPAWNRGLTKETDSRILKISRSLTGENNLNYNKELTEKWEKEKLLIKYCECGCGQLIEIKQCHKYYGIPNFIHGHNKGMLNKHHTEESKRKNSEAHKNMSEETRKKISIGTIKWIIKNKYKIVETSIEIAMEKQLKLNNYNYEKQKYIENVGIVDFFLPDFNVIIEVDGNYWHNRKGVQQKDTDRDFKATLYHNYRTIRFWEHKINENIEGCMIRLKKYI